MTVKEVFELRRKGRIEEAYEAIRPMYAVHKGKYTTLCMFWTASDILKKRIREERFVEAEKIFLALQRVLPNIEDGDGRALSSMLYEAVTLDKASPSFSMLGFLERLNVECLSARDWQDFTPKPHPLPSSPSGEAEASGSEGSIYTVPSVASQLLARAFVEIEAEPTVDNALKVMPLLQEAMRRNPGSRQNRHYMSVIYRLMGDATNASQYE